MSDAGYVELHCHSAYSFLDGASTPAELAATAAELGHEALALTDHDGVWGAMEHAGACGSLGLRSIAGAELTVAIPGPDGSESGSGSGRGSHHAHLTLLVADAGGWRNLCRLLTRAHAGTRPKPGRDPLPPAVTLDELERELRREGPAGATGLVCLTGCPRQGALAGHFTRAGRRPGPAERAAAERLGRRLVAIFGRDDLRVELQRPLWRHDRARNRWLGELAGRLGVACVATGDVHSHDPRRALLQDAFAAIRAGGTLEETESARRGNRSAHLVTPAAMRERLREYPEAVAETLRVADRLRFDLTSELAYRYPGSEDPTADRRLAELCARRFGERYRGSDRRSEATRRLEAELGVIRGLGLSGFFLLHHELLELAREVAVEVRGPESARSLLPPGRGRGSSVSSIVCYLTGLSHVDPVAAGLFPGRFLNEEISEMPDIDLDFPRDVRAALIPRVHERYGADRSALVAAFPTFRARGAIRELGKALGLPPVEIERVARATGAYGSDEIGADIAAAIGERRARSPRWRALAWLVREAWGLPRHASQHPGGMILSTRPLIDVCPVLPAAMEDRQIVQWDKDSCADAGFLKIDLLGLGMLSAVERCVEAVARTRDERLDLSRIPLDDPEVYAAIQRAETTGVFQIESRAQMQMLPRSLPANLEDLTVQVALVRPGPIQGGAVHPYLERRRRLRADPSYRIPYEHPSLEPILADTLGAIVFQDQVIQVAMALAGFSAGEAEGLRRAMSRKRSEAAIRAHRERFIEGCLEAGVELAVAERVFGQIQGFSGFGFPKSHAAAFGLLAYQSTWLRVHRAPEFLCALLNEQPMGFYPPDALIHEAQRRGIEVLAVDVNHSEVECSVERHGGGLAVRIGLGYVGGLAAVEAEAIVAERARGGRYPDLDDLAQRSGPGPGVSSKSLGLLAWAGACGPRRREALWSLGAGRPQEAAPVAGQLPLPLELPRPPRLTELGAWNTMVADYQSIGTTLGPHPLSMLRDGLEGMATTAELTTLPNRSKLELAGMVIARQRPETANGVVFMLLEDEHGVVNVIVPPPLYERSRLTVRTASLATVRGRLEREQGVINVVASAITELSAPGSRVATVTPIRRGETETRTADGGAGQPDSRVAGLAAVAPHPHSFGRRR